MGFYPPDALVHEAQRRGIDGAGARRQRERGRVHGADVDDGRRRRSGSAWATCSASRADEVAALVAAREGAAGRFTLAGRPRARARARAARRSSSSPGRARATRSRAATGAQVAVAARRRRARPAGAGRGTQLALPLDAAGGAGARAARRLGGDARRLRDDRPDGRARTRSGCCARRCAAGARSRAPICEALPHGAPGPDRRPRRRPPAPGDGQRASSSCCSRTSTARSTSSCRRRSTSATASRCAPSRWSSPRAASSAIRRRAAGSTCSSTASCARRARPADTPAGRGQGLLDARRA